MRLSKEKVQILRDLIVALNERPFSEPLVLEAVREACDLIDAQYCALLLFNDSRRTAPLLISNNPPEFIPVYRSVMGGDFLTESLVEGGRECVLARMSDFDQPRNRDSIHVVQSARPISDVIYEPLKAGKALRGYFAIVRAGLFSEPYSDDEVDTFRFVGAFLNDAFERTFLSRPADEDIACLDFEGDVVNSGLRIRQAFEELFGSCACAPARASSSPQAALLIESFRRYLRGPRRPGMDCLELAARGRRYRFAFSRFRPSSLPICQRGIPIACVRLVDGNPGIPDFRAPAQDHLASDYGLTPREREVVAGIYEGKSNKQIAFEMRIDESTVKRHTHNIYEKTGFRSRVELVIGLPLA
jgi:DNA-binding CsgD family transcriptional regulator